MFIERFSVAQREFLRHRVYLSNYQIRDCLEGWIEPEEILSHDDFLEFLELKGINIFRPKGANEEFYD